MLIRKIDLAKGLAEHARIEIKFSDKNKTSLYKFLCPRDLELQKDFATERQCQNCYLGKDKKMTTYEKVAKCWRTALNHLV